MPKSDKEQKDDAVREEKRSRGSSQRRRKRQLKKRFLIVCACAAVAVLAVRSAQLQTDREAFRQLRALQERAGDESADETDLLVLVSRAHPLPADYTVQLHWLQNGSCAVAEEMYAALRRMLTDGSTDGREFVVASGYRDAGEQKRLLEEDIAASMQEGLTYQEAYEKETQETMPAGCSEHETGLAADIVSLGYQVLDGQQEQTAENRWLQENCSRYGFILRYPKGSEAITGISYEPWHFRYVGEAAAQEIMSRGITLEEYLGEA